LTPSTTEEVRAPLFWGPFTGIGVIAALAALAIDQASKLWLLFVYDIAEEGAVALTSFFDLVLVWNKGISYGWFQQESAFGQWALLGLKLIAVVLLWVWMARAARWSAVSLGLIIGGAIGNAIDRLAYGAVADFAHFHITTASWNFSWYVFNLADVAIVVGVAGLLYESLFGASAVKAPRSGA
jgi:signal peptidase II